MIWLCELSWVWVLAWCLLWIDWSTVWAVEFLKLYPLLFCILAGDVEEILAKFYDDRLTASDSVGWLLRCLDGLTRVGDNGAGCICICIGGCGCGCCVNEGSVVICSFGLFLSKLFPIWLVFCCILLCYNIYLFCCIISYYFLFLYYYCLMIS